MDIQRILAAVDDTLLAPDATWAQIQGICDDAKTWHTAPAGIPAVRRQDEDQGGYQVW